MTKLVFDKIPIEAYSFSLVLRDSEQNHLEKSSDIGFA
jgi:hypothetical protein